MSISNLIIELNTVASLGRHDQIEAWSGSRGFINFKKQSPYSHVADEMSAQLKETAVKNLTAAISEIKMNPGSKYSIINKYLGRNFPK